jgi:hypothetical protein
MATFHRTAPVQPEVFVVVLWGAGPDRERVICREFLSLRQALTAAEEWLGDGELGTAATVNLEREKCVWDSTFQTPPAMYVGPAAVGEYEVTWPHDAPVYRLAVDAAPR